MSGRRFLRARDIAERLGLSERTIRRFIADGTLPAVKIGGARLVAEADLIRALELETKVIETVVDVDAPPEAISMFYPSVVTALTQ